MTATYKQNIDKFITWLCIFIIGGIFGLLDGVFGDQMWLLLLFLIHLATIAQYGIVSRASAIMVTAQILAFFWFEPANLLFTLPMLYMTLIFLLDRHVGHHRWQLATHAMLGILLLFNPGAYLVAFASWYRFLYDQEYVKNWLF